MLRMMMLRRMMLGRMMMVMMLRMIMLRRVMKCKSAFHKSHFRRKFTAKMLRPRLSPDRGHTHTLDKNGSLYDPAGTES